MTRLIDPPDLLLGTLQDWRDFLEEMKRIEPKDEQVREEIANAERVIADKTQPQT